jgi:hypothetical protein
VGASTIFQMWFQHHFTFLCPKPKNTMMPVTKSNHQQASFWQHGTAASKQVYCNTASTAALENCQLRGTFIFLVSSSVTLHLALAYFIVDVVFTTATQHLLFRWCPNVMRGIEGE